LYLLFSSEEKDQQQQKQDEPKIRGAVVVEVEDYSSSFQSTLDVDSLTVVLVAMKRREACFHNVGGEEASKAVEDVDMVVVAHIAHDSGNQDQAVERYQVADYQEENVLALVYNIALVVGLQAGSLNVTDQGQVGQDS
jgi:hypothetical protein